MEKKEQEKKLKTLIGKLESGNEAAAIGALKEIREHGNEKIIPAMVELLVTTSSEQVQSEIVQILFQLKSGKVIDPLIKAIQNPDYKNYQSILVQSFWQSGIDTSDHLTFFVDTAIAGDYMTCLECLTVIENLEGPFDEDEIVKNMNKLNEQLTYYPSEGEKDDLLRSLVEVLNNFIVGK